MSVISPAEQPNARSVARNLPVAHALLMACVRLSLFVAAVGIILVGMFQLPDTVSTRGELVVGEVLAITVGLQMLVAACFFPTPTNHAK